jgi:hypothetical protein
MPAHYVFMFSTAALHLFSARAVVVSRFELLHTPTNLSPFNC